MNDQEISKMYLSGMSIAEIMRQTSFGRTKVVNSMKRTKTELRENASAAVPVPLKPEEIPEEHRISFNFDSQYTDGLGAGRRGLVIERRCSHCSRIYTVVVSNIRGDLRRGRKMYPGKCGDCRGRVVSGEGYVLLHRPDHPYAYQGRYVPEHILVMEESLGRYLDRSAESVHHVNGDRGDNRLENLQLRNRYHGKGQAWECQDCGGHNVLPVELKN